MARSFSHVVAWQWAGSENSAAYTALLEGLAPPLVVTTDGAGGALKALRALWPDTPIQRCLLHVHRDTTRDHPPPSDPGRQSPPGSVSTSAHHHQHRTGPPVGGPVQSDYTTTFGPWLDERTFADDNPQHAAATGRK